MFELVIAADWSAEQGRKPAPQENRCWLAWGTTDHHAEPEYMPTRLEAIDRILSILDDHAGARTLLGFDFAIGYPLGEDGRPVLPEGRELCALLHSLVQDDRSGHNNRFHAAAELNQRIRSHTGAEHGPFWGRPQSLHIDGLPPTRPGNTRVRKLRNAERAARSQSNAKPKSPWQLAGIGSVGGQSLVGLKAVHTLLSTCSENAHLWPFEPSPDRSDAITIAEIYPSLFEERSPSYWYKDARQVVDSRDAILDHPNHTALLEAPDIARIEGWILGVRA
ncbi:MAG: hypothetical protein ACTS22_01530 [Phycisphaerales bacterium]